MVDIEKNDNIMCSEEMHPEVPTGTYYGTVGGWNMRITYNGTEYCWESVTFGIRGVMQAYIHVDEEWRASCNVY